mmetsp:Transcript_13967/g.21125  ORF Transcript_13967/g.21125 Transcript_13967/m.21125 type:complete len:326 (-) Transcript_13967:139-1116(-)
MGNCQDCCWDLRRNIPTLEASPSGLSVSKLSTISKVYAIVVLVQVIFMCGVCALIFFEHKSREADAFAVTWTVSAVAFGYFVIDSIRREDTVTLWVSVFAHVVVTGYSVYVYFSGKTKDIMGENYNKIALAVAIESSVAQIFFFATASQVQDTFGWYRHLRVGTDPRLHRLYRTYTTYYSFLKLDFVISVIVFTLASFLVLNTLELSLDIGALVLSFIFYIIGYYGVREESHFISYAFMAFCFVLPCYIVFKLIEIEHNSSFGVLLCSAVVAICVRAVLFVLVVLVVRNFGQGLRESVLIPSSIDNTEGKFIDGFDEESNIQSQR